MSQRSQLAHSRNFTLQRQLEDKFLDLRRMFKYSRRRLDTLEEDCVASLYKLLLYAREKQDISEAFEASLINDVFRGPKSARHRRPGSVFSLPSKSPETPEGLRRPATAMSAKTYTQSYSFVKDGMNIDKTRRDRYLRTKAQKERDKQNNIKIERLVKDGEFSDFERPHTVADFSDSKETTGCLKADTIPQSTGPHSTGPSQRYLARPQTTNILLPTFSGNQRTSTPNVVSFNVVPLGETMANSSRIDSQNEEVSAGGYRKTSDIEHKLRPSTTRNLTSMKVVHENSAFVVDGAKSPIMVRITTTHVNDAHKDERLLDNSTPFRPDSQFDNLDDDEELIPLADEDKDHLEKLTQPNDEDSRYKTSHSRHNVSQSRESTRNSHAASSSDVTTNSEEQSLLQKSLDKTQTFLKQYSKRSKVFGYVVKTRSSIIAPREKVVSHRSPCITYQELVSIKAGIKQQESKTKSLLHRSAKLSKYVDKLATAGEIRERMRELKQTQNRAS